MKLLQIFNQYLYPGGEADVVERISRLEAPNLLVEGCFFSSREWNEQKLPASRQAGKMIKNPDALRQLRNMQRDTSSDIWLLHNLFPVGSAAIYREIKRSGIPAITYIHNFRPFSVNGYLWANEHVETAGLRKNFWPEIRAGAWQDSKVKTFWYAMILKGLHAYGAYRRMDGWIAISDFMRNTFIEAGIEASKIRTLRHSWDPLPSPPSHRDNGHYLFLGRLAPMKGISTLLETWALLTGEMRSACPRLIICGDGPLREVVERFASTSKTVEFAGQVSGVNKSRLISGCRAMIAPSVWWEALGLVTYEAYDFGKPMLAARSGGLNETVVDGKTGYLHDPGNAEELSRQILTLETTPGLRQAMGEEGRAWLLANTSKEKWVAKFQQFLHDVISNRT